MTQLKIKNRLKLYTEIAHSLRVYCEFSECIKNESDVYFQDRLRNGIFETLWKNRYEGVVVGLSDGFEPFRKAADIVFDNTRESYSNMSGTPVHQRDPAFGQVVATAAQGLVLILSPHQP